MTKDIINVGFTKKQWELIYSAIAQAQKICIKEYITTLNDINKTIDSKVGIRAESHQ